MHAAVLADATSKEIYEAYWPHVRRRALAPEELREIDVFDVPPMTAAMDAAALAWCEEQVKANVRYDVADPSPAFPRCFAG